MRARILAARQKTTEYRLHTGNDGTRVRWTPVANEFPHSPSFSSSSPSRCRHLSARRKRDVVRRSPRGLLLHSCALERWPRITVQECRKRPARHSVRAARYKRCREPAPLFPTFAINYLSFCWWRPIPFGTSAPCFKCETSHYNKENLSRVSYLRMNKTLLQIRSDKL